MPGLEHQDPVARRQRVDQRRLPRPGAGRGIDHDGAGGLEDALHPGDDLLAEFGEFRAAMVDRWERDRVQDPVGNIGRAGDLQEMATGMAGRLVFHTARLQRETPQSKVDCILTSTPGEAMLYKYDATPVLYFMEQSNCYFGI